MSMYNLIHGVDPAAGILLRCLRPKTMRELSDGVLAEINSMTPEQIENDPRFKPLIETISKVLKP